MPSTTQRALRLMREPRRIPAVASRRYALATLSRMLSSRRLEVELWGSELGGSLVVPGLIDSTWHCIDVGIGMEMSFTEQLVHRSRSVLGLDPHPSVELWAISEATKRGWHNFRFVRRAVADRTGPIEMFAAADPSWVATLSAVDLFDSHKPVPAMGVTLKDLLTDASDGGVQLLKLDLEGGEYYRSIFDPRTLSAAGVLMVCLEFHFSARHGAGDVARLFEDMLAAGYVPGNRRHGGKTVWVNAGALGHSEELARAIGERARHRRPSSLTTAGRRVPSDAGGIAW